MEVDMKEQITSAGFPGPVTHNPEVDDVRMFSHPDDVLRDGSLTCARKREILSSWLSDMRTVEHSPALRRLDTGAVAEVDDILDALNELDGVRRDRRFASATGAASRRKRPLWPSTTFRRRSDDDDDFPPTAPAVCGFPRPVFADL